MASLRDLLNPVEVRKKTVKLLLNHNATAENEIPSSPESNFSDNTTIDYPPEEIPERMDHEPHPNCPDSLDCLPDTDGRPQHTLPVILRCAILGSPRKRLTIREIYAAMEGKYHYYRTSGPTWKQSVRHHLSLNRLFERQPRPATDPGFGSYWTVNLSAPPGTKRPRKRGRGNKAAPKTDVASASGSNSNTGTNTAVTEALASPPPSRRGRPRKELSLPPVKCEDMEGQDELMACEEGAQTPRDEEMYDESDEELLHPFDRRSSLIGLTNYPTSVHSSQSPLPPLDESSSKTIKRLESESAELRRQASDAVQLSIRLSDQLAQAHAEASRAKSALRSVEALLEEETFKRIEAEKMADDEMRLRKEAGEALLSLEKRWVNKETAPT
ncbi:hypothetical protein GGU11DRAFT_812127 [Lentinula aff. detonsa]|uniref:Fork-head domain-containing protein n=1 Tax=Lentinula aff. detonsa TaxID=2804958 RepID=A0AA38TZG6_9AGAR|nr:hypothetical protein GGU10DRAFT_344040 [Lentinula aff. detonsa]KAJ3793145.1 hypothetical protein GGU11DRAFT_812127 [Lentinula aff. detonsa]